MSWQIHPARERWKSALFATFVIVLAAWVTADFMQHAGWGAFAVFVLMLGCNRFFLPTRYELTTESITARFPLKSVSYDWIELRRFIYDRTGGFLSPRARRSFLDEYRGISLLFPEDADPVIQMIRGQLPKEAVVRELIERSALPKEGRSPCGG